jgi:hypothetical protein
VKKKPTLKDTKAIRKELEHSPRKVIDLPRRTSIVLGSALLLKLRTRAFEEHKTLTKYISEIITKATEK